MSTVDIYMHDLTATRKERMIRGATADPKFRDMTIVMEDRVYKTFGDNADLSVVARNRIYWNVFEAVSGPFRFEGEGVLW